MIAAETPIQCPTCCQTFLVPAELLKLRQEQHTSVVCPLGHNIVWPKYVNEATKLRKRIQELESDLTYQTKRADDNWKLAENYERRIRSLRGHIHRLQRLAGKRKAKA